MHRQERLWKSRFAIGKMLDHSKVVGGCETHGFNNIVLFIGLVIVEREEE